MNITVKGVEIELDGKVVVIPIEAARKLQQELNDLLGRDLTPCPVPYPVPYWPSPSWPCYPQITFQSPTTGQPLPKQPITTCSGDSLPAWDRTT